jgi:putative intracellular protease/amidase
LSSPKHAALIENTKKVSEIDLGKFGANYVLAGLWRGFAVRDGNLITGQQNFSGGETADLLIQTLGT